MYARGEHWGDYRDRPVNRNTGGCTCPAVRYDPTRPAPINPDCPHHGTEDDSWT